MDPRTTLVAYFEYIDSGETIEALKQFAPDAIYERPGYDALIGLDAISDFYHEVRVVKEGAHTVEDIAIDGLVGAAWGSFEGTHIDGTDISLWWCDAYRFSSDNRIAFRRSHFYLPGA